MVEFQQEEQESWKKDLRSELVTSLIGATNEKDRVFSQIGYYYTCCAPNFLYKYFGDNPERFETIKSNKMWYSAPCNFNDVFDCDISTNEKEIFDSVMEYIPETRRIRPGSPAWHQLREKIIREIKSLKTNLEQLKFTTGISCFSESDDSLLMWAHYANNHRGICVEYELLEINKQLRFTPIPVIYSENRVRFNNLSQETMDTDAMKVFIESLTSKSPEWSYEREWRIVRDNSACGDKWDKEKKGALLDMIRPKSVILGCMAEREFEKNVRSYCEDNRVDLYKMEKDEARYQLRKVSVLQY